MFGVDAKGLSSLCIDHPGELQDRTACGVQNQLLDLFGVAIDAVALPAEERDLRDRIHHTASGTPGRVSRASPDRIGRSRRLAPRVSTITLKSIARVAKVSCELEPEVVLAGLAR
jgi:hypothetical protein